MQSNYLQSYLESLHAELAGFDEGEVASYIPELAKADPNWFGIALVTTDGHVYQVGDSRQEFTIQSISKAITYGMALHDKSVDSVVKKVDVEPSGEAFNSISLEPDTGRPKNPMINAGAIATVSLIKGDSPASKLQRMLTCYEQYLGHKVMIDEEVYLSEKSTGHRNRAIAYLLRNSNIIETDTDDVLDLYFKQCSILVNCRDLAVIGAVMANNGVNPITGVRALESHHVPKVLSVMSSCGMYDYSGAWVFEVGMPAKSGVGGGIMAVLPGQFGLAVFSPKLDDRGNSARGIAACKKISADFGLHMLHTGRSTSSSVIHASYDAEQVPSKRYRPPRQTVMLMELGCRINILELQGELMFSSAEIVIHEVMDLVDKTDFLILDITRTSTVSEGAERLFAGMILRLQELGKTVLFTGTWGKYESVKRIKKATGSLDSAPLFNYQVVDDALEWCEDQILGDFAKSGQTSLPVAEQAFLQGFTEEEMAFLESLSTHKTYEQGSYICREGDSADFLYFILSGQVSIFIHLDQRRSERVSALSAGSAFGEMAMLDRGKRSADVLADEEVTCLVLDYIGLEADQSSLALSVKLKLVTNISRELNRRIRQNVREIKMLRS
ncbi:MAG: glutaminase A [Proteobacteria bacterium ST_bin11]|nr:MAG: glutaminase A [Proteobacteria bacterium ST_bin11]